MMISNHSLIENLACFFSFFLFLKFLKYFGLIVFKRVCHKVSSFKTFKLVILPHMYFVRQNVSAKITDWHFRTLMGLFRRGSIR